MKTSKGHLTYCTNIHSGENWVDHFAALRKYFPAIKKEVSPDAPMGIGLRLSNIASLELIKQEQLDIFKQWITDNDAYVFTINGFPYGGFHNVRVKDQVHAPDWTTNERVEYTRRLFTILSELLPEGMDGGVSTSPLSYKYWFLTGNDLKAAKRKATENIIDITNGLINIFIKTGKTLHLDIEPEPDGILETGAEFMEWFKEDLLVCGVKQIASTFSVSEDEAEKLIKNHIRLCYDVCHFAIGYEVHEDFVQRLKKDGIKVGKIQISAALKVQLTEDSDNRLKVEQAFTSYNEPTYLHQVVALKNDSSFVRYPDLPQALADIQNPEVKEWRAHFHVPVFIEEFGVLQSTQNEISEVLDIHKNEMMTSHLEVETYTWEVLPEALKLPMQQSITRELNWILNQLSL